MVEFAVVDVETTGLFPNSGDRIVEIAVVRFELGGTPELVLETLINPHRDVGPTNRHGIRAGDVVSAPDFEDVADLVFDALAGAIVAGHNVQFDIGFVSSDSKRCGLGVPLPVPRVCTLREAARLGYGASGRSLAACCRTLGIPLENEHRAADDAMAAARLLTVCLDDRALCERAAAESPFSRNRWPRVGRLSAPVRRHEARARFTSEPSYIAQLVSRLPQQLEVEADSGLPEYFDLLDRVLEDRVVTPHEAEALAELAGKWGFSGSQLVSAHETYFDGLIAAALDDQVVTGDERHDLVRIARLLRIDDSDLDGRIELMKTRLKFEPQALNREEEWKGHKVCFTGESVVSFEGRPMTRAVQEELATAAGLVVAKGVTKALDLLVVADPDTQSRKADTARRYGTRIVEERMFWRRLGVTVG